MSDLDFSAKAEPAGALDFSGQAHPIESLDAGTTATRGFVGGGGALLKTLDSLGQLSDPRALGNDILSLFGMGRDRGQTVTGDLAQNAEDFAATRPNEIPADLAADVAGKGAHVVPELAASIAGGGAAPIEATAARALPYIGRLLAPIIEGAPTATALTGIQNADLPADMGAGDKLKAAGEGELLNLLFAGVPPALGKTLPVRVGTGAAIGAGTTAGLSAVQGQPQDAASDIVGAILGGVLGGAPHGGGPLPEHISPEAVDAHLRDNPPAQPLAPTGGAEARAPEPEVTDAEFSDMLRLAHEEAPRALPAPDAAPPSQITGPGQLALPEPAIEVDPLGNARTSGDVMQAILDAAHDSQARRDLGLTPDTLRAIAAHDERTGEPTAEQRTDDAPPWWLAGQMAAHESAIPDIASPEPAARAEVADNQLPPPAPKPTPSAPPVEVGRAAATLPAGVDAARVRQFDGDIADASARVDRLQSRQDALDRESANVPGSFVTGRSNQHRGLMNRRQALNGRMAGNFSELQDAQRRLADLTRRRDSYAAGETHATGQPRADAPSRTARAQAVQTYGDYIKARVKPGDTVTFLPNPSDDAGRIVKRINKKSVTLDGGTTWSLDDIQPRRDGKSMSHDDVRADFRAWRNEGASAPQSEPPPVQPLPASTNLEHAPAVDDTPEPPLDIRYGKPRLPAKEALARATPRDEPLASEPEVHELSHEDLSPDERAALERQSAPRELSESDLTPAERESFARQRAAPAERGAERELTGQMAEQSRQQGNEDADRHGLRAAVDEVLAGAEGAPKVQFARDEDALPEGTRLPSAGGKKIRREGTYDPNNQSVHIFTGEVTTPERAAWVAAHEIAGHHGLRGLIGERAAAEGRPAREVLHAALDTARQNATVDKLADAIGAQRKSTDRHTMAEEAIAELAAATRTGNWDHIKDRYGVDVPEGVRSGAKTAVRRFIERIKALLAKLFKKVRFSDVDVHQLVEDAWQYVRKPRGDVPDREDAAPEARESVGDSENAPDREDSLESVAADSADIPKPKRDEEAPSRRPGESQRDYARRVMRTSKDAIREATALAKHQRKIGRQNFREMLGKQARAMDVADAAFAEARKTFDKTPEAINLATIDEWENGRPIKDRDAAQFFDNMKSAFDQRVERIRELDPAALQSLIENYFPHIWEDSAKASKWYQGFTAKRPLEGNKSFMKQRTWGTIKEGMASGLKPVSTNPVDLALLKLQQMDKFIAFHEFRDDLKERGWLKEMEAGARVPDGYAKIEDPAFAKAGGLQGYYAVPEMIARDVNNYLAPSLYRFGAWKAWRSVQNMLMSARLGWSMFHAGFTTFDNVVQHVGVGMQRATEGDITGALTTILHGAASPVMGPVEGSRLIDQWVGKRESDPHTDAMLHLLEQGGARMRMSQTEYNQSLPKLIRAIRQRKLNAGTVGDALSSVGEASSWIIHHWLVPRQKMAARVMLLKYELDHFAGALGKKRGDYAGIVDAMHPDVAKQLAGKVVDAVDNRLGQMTYDNQFWNKTAREIAQGLIGAVGWQVGTLRTVTGGARDLPRLFKPEDLNAASLDKEGKITDQKMGRFGGNLANLIALALVAGGAGAVLQYLLTGKWPGELKDYFLPKTGRRNADDTEERIQFPTYWQDHYKLATHPIQTAGHKLHPSIGMLMELAGNKDFYGVQVRDSEDPWYAQAEEVAKYIAKGFVPYSVTNAKKANENDVGIDRQAASFFGVTNAPASVSRTEFQSFVAEKAYAALPQGTRTQADKDHTDLMHAVEDDLRRGKQPDFADLSPKDRKNALKAAQQRVPEIRFRRLSIADKVRAYDIATPDERARYHLREIIMRSNPQHSQVFMRLPEDERKDVLARISAIGKEAATIGTDTEDDE